ncbi:hypothetical protein C8J57DRAFT_1254427 [Mycena rebaudengoi]|nr:hypothetical protein C8J57DRAFT_1254427 [Mycena rebaudengoi]
MTGRLFLCFAVLQQMLNNKNGKHLPPMLFRWLKTPPITYVDLAGSEPCEKAYNSPANGNGGPRPFSDLLLDLPTLFQVVSPQLCTGSMTIWSEGLIFRPRCHGLDAEAASNVKMELCPKNELGMPISLTGTCAEMRLAQACDAGCLYWPYYVVAEIFCTLVNIFMTAISSAACEMLIRIGIGHYFLSIRHRFLGTISFVFHIFTGRHGFKVLLERNLLYTKNLFEVVQKLNGVFGFLSLAVGTCCSFARKIVFVCNLSAKGISAANITSDGSTPKRRLGGGRKPRVHTEGADVSPKQEFMYLFQCSPGLRGCQNTPSIFGGVIGPSQINNDVSLAQDTCAVAAILSGTTAVLARSFLFGLSGDFLHATVDASL